MEVPKNSEDYSPQLIFNKTPVFDYSYIPESEIKNISLELVYDPGYDAQYPFLFITNNDNGLIHLVIYRKSTLVSLLPLSPNKNGYTFTLIYLDERISYNRSEVDVNLFADVNDFSKRGNQIKSLIDGIISRNHLENAYQDNITFYVIDDGEYLVLSTFGEFGKFPAIESEMIDEINKQTLVTQNLKLFCDNSTVCGYRNFYRSLAFHHLTNDVQKIDNLSNQEIVDLIEISETTDFMNIIGSGKSSYGLDAYQTMQLYIGEIFPYEYGLKTLMNRNLYCQEPEIKCYIGISAITQYLLDNYSLEKETEFTNFLKIVDANNLLGIAKNLLDESVTSNIKQPRVYDILFNAIDKSDEARTKLYDYMRNTIRSYNRSDLTKLPYINLFIKSIRNPNDRISFQRLITAR